MTDLAIRVENLGKRFGLGGRAPYHRFSELVTGLAKLPVQALRSRARGSQPAAAARDDSHLWALRNVSFDVRQGEVLGVIGRNGAGKSTLLKLLSRITEPTEGFARVRGRVGSLLEVGTGFHPELTGRENIYLNGAILGMGTAEIRSKFDQIVDFAEVERFLDTPVKRYSSGMYMRLAFAVAAHLEPEILVIDEVLAVGDANFQKKCIGKMGEVARGGRTVLFVSHAMPAVQNLCHRALVLSQGQVSFLGNVPDAVQHYLSGDEVSVGCVDLSQQSGRIGSGELRLTRFWLENEQGKAVVSVPGGSRCAMAVAYEAPDGAGPRRDVTMSIHINTMLGGPVSLITTDMLNENFDTVEPQGIIRLHVPRLPLTAGRYVLDFNIATHGGHSYADFIKTAAALDVTDGDFYGTGRPGNPGAPVTIDANWEIEAISPTAAREIDG